MILEHFILKTKTRISTVKLGIKENVLEDCKSELYRLGDSMNNTTNVQGIMTSYKLWEESKVFNTVIKKIVEVCNTLHEVDPRYTMVLPEIWGAIYKKGHYARHHSHLPSTYSFVYYLNSPEINTPLIFPDADFEYLPIKDSLIFFPSNLSHYVPTHKGDDRLALAGNFIFMSDNSMKHYSIQ